MPDPRNHARPSWKPRRLALVGACLLMGCSGIPKRKLHDYTHEVETAACPAAVWAVIVDFERYEEWNPSVLEVSGPVEDGGRLRATAVIDMEGNLRKGKHEIVGLEPGVEMCWRDVGAFVGLTQGMHCRTLVELEGGGTRIEQLIRVGGTASGLVDRKYGEVMQWGIEVEAEALDARAEGLAADVCK